ncbi:hypothetical protein JTB14_035343 [Gonioctena quinquepunctata]|nr:hypothetical protein JTB14_035343 [Gonioctena quinquepunctata]
MVRNYKRKTDRANISTEDLRKAINEVITHKTLVWNDNRIAGIEWMRSFMERHPELSYRKPENISIARTSGFNKSNVEIFFKNYSEVMIKYKFSPDRIVNTDESGVLTVMQAPRIITKSGMKQVGQCVSSERGTLVTFCGIITATGVAIPPLYIFPRVRMKDQYMYGSVPGAIRTATKSDVCRNICRTSRTYKKEYE